MENKENKYTTLVGNLTRDLLNKTVEHGFITISTTNLKHFKGVKNVEIDIRLYDISKSNTCGWFQVRTIIRNDYIAKDLFQDVTNLEKSPTNLITKEVIEEIANIIIKQMNTLNDLQIHRERYSDSTMLFEPFKEDQFNKNYLFDGFEDIEFENDTCCICYKRTSTKIECCKVSVCKVCLIEIAHSKLPAKFDIETEEYRAKNKLVCPHCRKDHNDYRTDQEALLWAIQDERKQDDDE
jgi:hypothetical protein